MNPNRSITIFVFLFFLVCSISAFFIYFELQSKLTNIENQIELHNEVFVQLQSDLIHIQGSLGFGGLTSHLKNFQINQQITDLFKAQSALLDAKQYLAAIRVRLDSNVKYESYLVDLETVLNIYEAQFATLNRITDVEKLLVIEDMQTIDDDVAIDAIAGLELAFVDTLNTQNAANHAAVKSLSNFLSTILGVFLPLLISVGCVFIFIYLKVNDYYTELTAVMRGSNDAIIVSNEDGKIVRFNQVAQTLFGYTHKEFSELYIEDLVNPNEKAHHKNLRSGYIVNVLKPKFDKNIKGDNVLVKMNHGSFLGAKKSGELIPIKINLTGYKINGKIHLLASLKDQTYIRKLEYKTQIEPFTNLANKETIKQSLSTEIERSRRHEHSLSIIFIDIDRFKTINDKHGHQIGDEVIKALSDCIAERVRDSDVLGRFGGDEFIIICPECTGYQAAVIAEQIRKNITKLNIHDLDITISLGITECQNQDTVKTLLGRADRALYEAKENGRNTIKLIE